MRIGRFFLDIRGTITCKDFNKEREYLRSVGLIRRLIAVDQLDELRISLVSSDKIEVVEEYGYILDSIFKNVENVKLGYHHASESKMQLGKEVETDFNNKCFQMLGNLEILEHSHCYYADDCKINRVLAEKTISKKFPNMKFVAFDPEDKELNGLNNELEKYLLKQEILKGIVT